MNRRLPSLVYLGICAVAIILAFWNPLARSAADYNKDVAIGGTALYGTLRTVNAVMSVAKQGEVHVSVGVASGSRSPGQVLQPVTETINRTADALFLLIIVAGALSVTMAPLSAVASVMLAASTGILALTSVTGLRLPPFLRRGSISVMQIGLLGALIVPGAYGLAFLVGDRVTASAWSEASSVIERIDATYGDVPSEIEPEPFATRADLGPEAVPATEQEPSDAGGLFRGGLQVFGSALDASRGAIANTVDAASGLASSVSGAVVDNVSIVVNAMSLGSDLFRASVEVVVAYVVKLIVLPILVIAGALYVLRSTVGRVD